ncbi:MAG: hypothetical protein ACR2QE_01620 [Acidimicrobiales bacterium]
MRTAADFVPDSTSGHRSEIEIAAPPQEVWQALLHVGIGEMRASGILLGLRSLPARFTGGGSMRRPPGADRPLVEAMVAGRFVELARRPPSILTLGIIGQFWRLRGGADVAVDGPDQFMAFDEPGYVRAAIDFAVVEGVAGSRLITETCNRATSEDADRRFRWYWRVVGPGSKLIRLDLLRAIRRHATAGSHRY